MRIESAYRDPFGVLPADGEKIKLNVNEQKLLLRAHELLVEIDRVAIERQGIEWQDGHEARTGIVLAEETLHALALGHGVIIT